VSAARHGRGEAARHGIGDIGPLLAVLAGAGLALLGPRLFGDPQSSDPDAWRLTAYFFALWICAAAVPRLRAVAPLAFAFTTLALPYSVWILLLGWPDNLPGVLGAADSLGRTATAGVAELAIVLVMAAGYRWRCPLPTPSIRLLRLPRPRVLLVTGVGAVVFLAIAFLLPAQLLGREGVPLLALAPPNAFAYLVANAANATAQEVQFRGVLLAELERGHPATVAVVFQAVIFGVAHIAVQYAGPSASFIPIVTALGLVWGWLTRWTDSLWPAIVIHIVADLFITVAILGGLYGL